MLENLSVNNFHFRGFFDISRFSISDCEIFEVFHFHLFIYCSRTLLPAFYRTEIDVTSTMSLTRKKNLPPLMPIIAAHRREGRNRMWLNLISRGSFFDSPAQRWLTIVYWFFSAAPRVSVARTARTRHQI